MEPVVSIIVPVYNAQNTIRRCVDSILGQTFRDFELILVDDGSTDECPAILDEYAKFDARVRVIHQKNAGVSVARNRALDAAKGEYLQFLDSDDWIIPDATKLLVRTAQENRCDLVVADFYRVVGERVSHKGDIGETGVLNRTQYAAHMMDNPADFYYGVLWNKLYSRQIVEKNHLRMDPAIRWCEDFMFNLEYIRHAQTFCALQVPIYYYVKTKGSLVSQGMRGVSNTIAMKRMAFACYHEFYKCLLDEEEYEKSRLKVYKFLIDAAGDGAVLPSIFPGTQKLGHERLNVDADTVTGGGALMDQMRSRRLLEHYLEIAAIKNDLSIEDCALLLYCADAKRVAPREELSKTLSIPRSTLAASIMKLTSRGFLAQQDTKDEKKQLVLLPQADPILRDIRRAQDDYEQAALETLSDDELETYAALHEKIQRAVLDRLGE